MVVGVDQYKRIRKMAAEEGLSQREIARRLGISRNTVARYCKGEHMPWEQARRARKPGVVNQDIERFIRSCLEHDKDPDVPKKQHHTARRIYERLVAEKGFTGGESTVRRTFCLRSTKSPDARSQTVASDTLGSRLMSNSSRLFAKGNRAARSRFCRAFSSRCRASCSRSRSRKVS